MATTTLADQPLAATWTDLTIALPSLASVDATIQNLGPGSVAIVCGSDPTGLGESGIVLGVRETLTVNSAHVWGRCIGPAGVVSVTTL